MTFTKRFNAPVQSFSSAAATGESVRATCSSSSALRCSRSAEASTGFLYAIGRVGITGARTTFDPEVLTWLDRVRDLAGETPLAVGFGVADGAAVAALGGHCDLAISGTALVRALHDAGGTPEDAARVATAFTTALGAGAP